MSQLHPLRLFVKTLDLLASCLPLSMLRVPVSDTGVRLSPLLHWLLHLRRLKNGSGDLMVDTPELTRQDFIATMQPLRAGLPVRAVRDLTIPGPAGDIKARHYRPLAEGELPALLVYLHGGGYVVGDLDTHDDLCRQLCRETGMQVLAVDYRLAPENPFPAGLDDAEAAVRWAQLNAAQFDVAPGAIAISGDSSAGNIAAVIAQRLAKSADSAPLLAQLLAYPVTDFSTLRNSHHLFGEGFFLSLRDRAWFLEQYVGHDLDLAKDVSVSPLLNENPGKLAPALIITVGFDIVRDEGEAYVELLRSHGTEVEHIRFENMGHGFLLIAGVHRDSALAFSRITKQFRLLCQRQLGHEVVTGVPMASLSTGSVPG